MNHYKKRYTVTIVPDIQTHLCTLIPLLIHPVYCIYCIRLQAEAHHQAAKHKREQLNGLIDTCT